jgi:hypothetical protein
MPTTENASPHLPSRSSQRALRVNNVMRRLNMPERTVRHLAKTQKIPAFKLNRKSWGFWPEDVDRYKQLREERDAECL